MPTYSEERYFFDKFVEEVDKQGITSGEKKLVNLIIKHFDTLAPLGTASGRRAKKLNELIESEGVDISDVVELGKVDSIAPDFPIKALHSIAIENFRGFSSLETIDLNKKYVFVYGPNGSGKTSFFEALEYSMLGDINEANARRVNIGNYIRNLQTGTYKAPILKVKNNDDKIVQIISSRSDYQFCFVERNRIESFARVSSFTRENQTNLLATLFGLDTFNKFVGEFTESIEHYVDVEGVKAKDLKEKERSIEVHKRNIETSKTKLEEIELKKGSIILPPGLLGSFQNILEYIEGTIEKIGRIKELDQELEKPVLQQIEIKLPSDIYSEAGDILGQFGKYSQDLKTLRGQTEKISFRKLYEAVRELQPSMADKCPACLTPIKKGFVGWRETKRDPYKAAENGLQELQGIALLEQRVIESKQTIIERIEALSVDIDVYSTACNNKISSSNFSGLKMPKSFDDASLPSFVEDITERLRSNKEVLENIWREVIAYNNKVKNVDIYRASLKKEKEELTTISKNIIQLQVEEATYRETIKEAEESTAAFLQENAELLKEVGEEGKKLKINRVYVDAYKTLIPKLTRFKDDLPTRWIKDLAIHVKEIYNVINHNDERTELIDDIKLPQKADDKIMIAFQDKPGSYFDALHILSEGHLRCLGLAILLAKNTNDKKSVVIFDDVVNAIDDDHRSGIRQLLFEHSFLKEKQLVITSHSEEFVKDIEHDIAAKDYDKLVNKLTFLPPTNRQIRVLEKNAFNYLRKAKDSLDTKNKRDALANCRRALENITDVLWKRLSNKYNTAISVAVRRPASRPELMSVVNGLCSYIQKQVTDAKFTSAVPILQYLQGLETKSAIIWNLLNKGTHEEDERDDFDEALVVELYERLLSFDTLLKS